MKTYKLLILIMFFLFSIFSNSLYAICRGTSINPVTDVAWHAIYPLTVSGITIIPNRDKVITPPSCANASICYCPIPLPPYYRVGSPIGIWEGARAIEVVKDPYCFPMLATSSSNSSAKFNYGQATTQQEQKTNSSFYQAHSWVFPLFSLMEFALNSACMESSSFDVAYLTELDSMWQDDDLASVIQPEAILFSNPASHFSCFADTITSAVGISSSPLFWCNGSMGVVYPLTGRSSSSRLIKSSFAVATKFMYKLAREFLLWDYNVNYCTPVATTTWIKHNYKLQLVKPIRTIFCNPIGKPAVLFETLKNPTHIADNFLWLQFRRRGCCAF